MYGCDLYILIDDHAKSYVGRNHLSGCGCVFEKTCLTAMKTIGQVLCGCRLNIGAPIILLAGASFLLLAGASFLHLTIPFLLVWGCGRFSRLIGASPQGAAMGVCCGSTCHSSAEAEEGNEHRTYNLIVW